MTPASLWSELELCWGQALRQTPTKAIAGILIGKKGALASSQQIVFWARRIVWDWVSRSQDDSELCVRLSDALNMVEKIYEEQPVLLEHWCQPKGNT